VIGVPLATAVSFALAVALPSGPAFAGTVTVLPGQTLSQVAAEENTTVAALAAANGITNPDLVRAGAVLQIPGAPAAAPAPAPPPAPTPAAPATTTVTVQLGETLTAPRRRPWPPPTGSATPI
jgi:LysM repeat protein